MKTPLTYNLTGQLAIITGGTGSIGGLFAQTLAAAGARVVVLGRGITTPVQDAVKRIKEGRSDLPVYGYVCNTMDEQEFDRTWQTITNELGNPTILVNAAGGNKGKASLVDVDLQVFQEVVQSNLLGGLMVPAKVAAREWINRGVEGCMINITSMASYNPLSGIWAYNASKSAVLNLTSAFAKELAPHGIRVNAIAPGFFVGNQNRDLLFEDYEAGKLTPRGQSIIDRTPFGRFGKLEELAGSLLFLCDTRFSGFVTGVSLPVDGGFLTNNI